MTTIVKLWDQHIKKKTIYEYGESITYYIFSFFFKTLFW